MATIRNTSGAKSGRKGNPIGLHDAIGEIPPGGSKEITDAQAVALLANPVVQAWIRGGVIAIENVALPGKAKAKPAAATPAPIEPEEEESEEEEEADDEGNEAEAKDALIAELARYGVTKDRRSSVATLTALLEKAKKKKKR